MAEPSEKSKSVSEQVRDILISLVIAGSGGSALFFIYTNELPKAVISAGVTAISGLFSSYGKGLGQKLNEGMEKRGQATGEVIDEALDRGLDRAWSRLARREKEYLEALKVHCTAVEIEGFQVLTGLALEDVFVPLQIIKESASWEERAPKQIWDFLPQQGGKEGLPRRLVILAAPGYGKTTLLRHLTLTYATEARHELEPLLPVLLRFRDIHTLIQDAQVPSLSGLVVGHVARIPDFAQVKPTAHWIEERLREGKALVLLDGLDEVPRSQQNKVREWVEWQLKAQAYQRSRFILTSRPYGFELQPEGPGQPITVDLKLRILDFTPDQKQEFIERWYAAIFWKEKWKPILDGNPRRSVGSRLAEEQVRSQCRDEADRSAQDLVRQLFTNPPLNDLARNPLLITMIAATHQAETQLPSERVDLYRTICDLLLWKRPRVKRMPLTLTPDKNRTLLQLLAWELMQAGITQFQPEQGEEWIQAEFDRCKTEGYTFEHFWHEIRDIAGLLTEKEIGSYEFTHKTFQEYFTALHLSKQDRAVAEEILSERIYDEKWKEVIEFYVAMRDATFLIEKLIEDPNLKNIQLARQYADRARSVDPQTRADLKILSAEWIAEESLEATLNTGVSGFKSLFQVIDRSTTITTKYISLDYYRLFLEDQNTNQFHSQAAPLPDLHTKKGAVTGISRKDALWFCAWLASRSELREEGKVYDYRLPTPEEIQQFPATEGSPDLIPWTTDLQTQGNALRIVRQELPERYGDLVGYLAGGRWQAADEETFVLMLEISDRKEQGFLDDEAFRKFPCEHLRILDQLWVKFSGSRFGFSVQKQIFIEVGGKLGQDSDYKIWRKLSDQVGWYVNQEWLQYSDLNFSLNAPEGHLPNVSVRHRCFGLVRRRRGFRVLVDAVRCSGWASLLSRRDL